LRYFSRRNQIAFFLLMWLLIAPTFGVIAANEPRINGKIAFNSDRDGNWEIYVMNPDGSGQTRLTNNNYNDKWPSWSPDGTKIAFSRDLNGNWEIYAMNADGSGETRLTNNNYAEELATWSPDGTKIVFSSNRDGNYEIYVMNADGSGQTRLTNNNYDDAHNSWSPDGTKIAFLSDRDGNYEIYVMNADGSGQTRLTNNNAGDVIYGSAWQSLGKKTATLTLQSSTTNTMVDTPFNLKANLSAPKSGTVTLHWSINNSGFIYRRNETMTSGVIDRAFEASTPGTWAFKVAWAGDDEYKGTESNNVTVTIRSIPTLAAVAKASPATVDSGGSSTIRATLTSGGTAVKGATVNLASSNGGAFSSVTDQGNGTYVATYTAQEVVTQTVCTITVSASKPGYIGGSGQTQVTVQPLVIKIYLKASDGSPIAGAAVSSTSQPSGQTGLDGRTDVNGLVVFTGILKGSYTMKVSKSGFDDGAWTGAVSSGQAMTLNIVLSTSFSMVWVVAGVVVVVLVVALFLVFKRRRSET